ncbi:Eco57I restriction-modification methylase domain-containing protein, partial [bacterium]|nr:Eco57I restriction-modification methylase domain-containing protein [bacterium]
LYGVDIQEQAVRVCELRLWLSLVVDYERGIGEDVPPLPNLSYKVKCGDSLIEKLFGHNVQLDQLVRTNRGRQLIDEIRGDKEAYFLTRDIEEKKKKELAILYKQCELAEMLVKEKRSWLKDFGGVQSAVFGETAKERQQREEKRKELEEYDRVLCQAENTKKKVQAMLQGKQTAFLDDIHRLRESFGLSFIWKLDFAEVFKEKGGFDIAIANPPYVSFGLRDVGKAKGEWADYMRKNYPNSAEYKLSIYAIFMDKGLQLLRDKGILSFITPDSFLLGRYFSKLRGFVLRACRIKEIVMFEKDFWQAGVVGRPVISNIQRYSDTNARSVKSVHCLTSTLCSSIDKLERGTLRSFSYEQRYFEGVPHNRFRLFFEPREKAIVEKLESNSEKLWEAVTFSSGLIGRTGKKEIISDKRLGEKWHPGLLSGREINQYCINYEGNFTLFDTKKLKSGFKDARYFEPKIFLRQTGDSLVAAYDTENLLCLNNLHVGNLANSKYDLRYVLAMLNSKLMNYYYHLISLELGRTMAQIDIETIELLPIKPVSLEVQNQFIGLVDKIMAIYNQSEAPLSSNNSERITELERRIDFKIYELYGLTSEETRLIEESA